VSYGEVWDIVVVNENIMSQNNLHLHLAFALILTKKITGVLWRSVGHSGC
jgi:hypothetical protein